MKSLSRSLLNGQSTKHNSGLGPRLATLLLLLPGVQALADWVGDARPMMGTEVSVYLWSDDPDHGRQALEEVFAEAERINRLMSTYIDGSEISEINRQAAERPVVAGEELFHLIQRSLDISVLTLGAFARFRTLSPGVVEDSPLVKDDDYISFGLGLAWSFWQSDERAP